MRNLSKKILLFCLFFSPLRTFGFYIEPLIGMRIKGNNDISSPIEKTFLKTSGKYYGGKVGFSVGEQSILGVDYRKGDMEAKFSSGSPFFLNTTYDTSSLGVFFKYNFVSLMSFWASYYPSNTYKVTSPTNATMLSATSVENGSTFLARRYAIGLGFEVIRSIHINIEYSYYQFDYLKSPDGTIIRIPNTFNASSISSGKGSDISLSISYPIDFFEST